MARAASYAKAESHSDLLHLQEGAIAHQEAARARHAAAGDGPRQAGEGSPESDPSLQQLTQVRELLGESQEQLAQREAVVEALLNERSAARDELAQQQQQAEAACQVCSDVALSVLTLW